MFLSIVSASRSVNERERSRSSFISELGAILMARKGKRVGGYRDLGRGERSVVGREGSGEKEIRNPRERYFIYDDGGIAAIGCGRIKTDRENVVSFLITRRIKSLDFSFYLRDKEWAERDLDYSWVARLPAHPVYVNPSVRQLLSIFFFSLSLSLSLFS